MAKLEEVVSSIVRRTTPDERQKIVNCINLIIAEIGKVETAKK